MKKGFNNEYLIADTHFGHRKIIELTNRPFNSVEEMDKQLIINWNNVVKKKDRIFVLGDFSFHNKIRTKEILEQLNGYKILVMGNHDRPHSVKWWQDAGFDEVYRYPILIDKYVLSHEIEEVEGFYNCHGHIHNNIPKNYNHNKFKCVSVELQDYKPIRIDKILREWYKK